MAGWMGGWMHGWMDGLTGWMDGWRDGWMDRWLDRWVDGWMDGWARRACGRCLQQPVGLRTPHRLMGLWKGLTSRVVLVSACCATTPLPANPCKKPMSHSPSVTGRLNEARYPSACKPMQKAHVSLSQPNGQAERSPCLTLPASRAD